jgi:hypothetical protein
MIVRWMLILMFVCTSCHIGLIPCPTVRADKVKRSHPRQAVYSPRLVTASAEIPKKEDPRRIRPIPRPALEKVNVEEWDCPKPGMKRNNMPKALRDNIRKNRRAFEDYYRMRSNPDSVSTKRR